VKPYGPRFYFPDQVPKTELEPVIAEKEPLGSMMSLYDARDRTETPVFLPEQHAVVFGGAVMDHGGKLRVWDSRWHITREIPALKQKLKLPFVRVIVSHFDFSPVYSRTDFEKALILEPFR